MSALQAVDDGLFGPMSVAWTLHREPALLVGGLRALMLQALHPLAIAAVADHSNYRNDVWGRFNRTSDYVVTTVYGDTASAERLGLRVRAIHSRVRGIDRVTGLPYSADDPDLLLWIHCTLVDSFLRAYLRFVRPLPVRVRDQYVAEMVRQAELVGLRPEQVPHTVAGNDALIRSSMTMWRLTQSAEEALDTVLNPPLPAHRRPGWWIPSRAAVGLLPRRALELYGLRVNPLAQAALTRLVATGSRLTASFGEPPPALRSARIRAAAAGHPI